MTTSLLLIYLVDQADNIKFCLYIISVLLLTISSLIYVAFPEDDEDGQSGWLAVLLISGITLLFISILFPSSQSVMDMINHTITIVG